jgi:hypothetical protein
MKAPFIPTVRSVPGLRAGIAAGVALALCCILEIVAPPPADARVIVRRPVDRPVIVLNRRPVRRPVVVIAPGHRYRRAVVRDVRRGWHRGHWGFWRGGVFIRWR